MSHLLGPLAEGFELGEKDSLSLINGSPCATALLADAVLAARRRLGLAAAVFALSVEAFQAPLDAYDPVLDGLWEDPHEATALAELRGWLEGAAAERRAYQAPGVLAHPAAGSGPGAARAGRSRSGRRDLPAGGLGQSGLHPTRCRKSARPGCCPTAATTMPRPIRRSTGLAATWADLALLCDRQTTKMLDANVSLLPVQLRDGDGYMGCLAFTAVAYAEQARHAAQRSFLPGSDGGGFGQNDVPVPTFQAWRKEAEAGRCLDANLAILAAIASQALHVTGRAAPPRLGPLLAEVRGLMPPMTGQRRPGPEAERLSVAFSDRIFGEAATAIGAAA